MRLLPTIVMLQATQCQHISGIKMDQWLRLECTSWIASQYTEAMQGSIFVQQPILLEQKTQHHSQSLYGVSKRNMKLHLS